MTRLEEMLEAARNRFEARKAIDKALFGSFTALADRLRSAAPLTDPERIFLADLLSGNTDFKVKWADGRKRRSAEVEAGEIDLANAVLGYMTVDGLSLEQACVRADADLRPGRGSRPATARSAYDKWRLPFWPAGSNGVQELPDRTE